MAIQTTNASGYLRLIDEQPKPELKGQGAGSSSALGSVGNRQYTAKQGGTARAGLIRTTLSDLRHFVANWQAKLTFFLTNAPQEARAQHDALVQNRKTNQCVANLLGDLTALAKDEKGRTDVAQRLEELITLADGDLNSRKGWEQSLSSHMGQLKDMDLQALYDGVLGDPKARDAVLDRISPDASNHLRNQAAGALKVINAALDLRSAQALIREPLANTMEQLSASTLDGQALHRQLSEFPQDVAKLDLYLQSLPKGEPEKVLFALRPENLEAVEQALSRVTDGSQDLARATLDRLRTSAEGVIHARAQPELKELQGKLDTAAGQADRFAAANVLRQLDVLLDKHLKACGSLPEGMVEDARAQVDTGLRLFRHAQSNPEGPLNRASMKKLHDTSLGYLHGAKNLRSLGLELDRDALNEECLARVEEHGKEFAKRTSHNQPKQLVNAMAVTRRDAIRGAMALIDDVSKREQAQAVLNSIRT